MAGYTPNYGAGAPGNAKPTHGSYYDYMTSTFLDHFDGLPARLNAGEELPPTLDSDRYFDDYDTNQSSTCAQLAVEFYNQQQGYSAISLDRAKDSHKFFSEGTAYFHVIFKAAFDGGSGPCYTFFAEIMGTEGIPERATMVVQFHTKEERRTRDNCLYCTGLSHPEEGGFVGHRRLPHHQQPPQAAAGDDNEEEGNGDEERGGDGEDADEGSGSDDDEEQEGSGN